MIDDNIGYRDDIKPAPCDKCGAVQAHFIDCPKTKHMGLHNQITMVCEHCGWREGHDTKCPTLYLNSIGLGNTSPDKIKYEKYQATTSKSYDVATTGVYYDNYFSKFNDRNEHNAVIALIQYWMSKGMAMDENARPSEHVSYAFKLLSEMIK